MEIKRLSSELSVCCAIAPADLPVLATAGFRAVVCNRPDGEASDQPVFSRDRARCASADSRCGICLRNRARSAMNRERRSAR